MKRTLSQKACLVCSVGAALLTASAFQAAASDWYGSPLTSGQVGTGDARRVTVVRAETLDFFFDDLNGLLGARLLNRNNKESGRVTELIVEKDGSVSGMIVAVPLEQTRSAMTSSAERAFVAGTDAYVRRKASTRDLVVIQTMSGEMIVKVKDHIADPQDFPEFVPSPATDAF